MFAGTKMKMETELHTGLALPHHLTFFSSPRNLGLNTAFRYVDSYTPRDGSKSTAFPPY